MASEQQLRDEICAIARALYERGHNAPLDGNVSARLSDRYILTTPSARHKGRLCAADVVRVRAEDGLPIDARQRASSEIRMHVAIYRERPDVGAIVHAHSPCTVGLTVAGYSMETPVVPEAIMTLGAIPTVPYASPSTADVPDAVRPHLAHANAFVLERHGPVVLGRDLDEAFARLETLEHTAKITLAALTAGSAKPIEATEATKLRELAHRAGWLDTPAARAEAEERLVAALVDRVFTRLSGELNRRSSS